MAERIEGKVALLFLKMDIKMEKQKAAEIAIWSMLETWVPLGRLNLNPR